MHSVRQAGERPAARVVEMRPRVIQQFTAIFLVSREGDVWRVYDSDSLHGWGRRMPSDSSDVVSRVFVGIGRATTKRIHHFKSTEDRSLTADRLQAQLDAAKPVS
jgi:hypothetical protein